ncbi:neurocan core protein-like isoform X6 [Mytilus californianus]|uniref:neurocan core protein-like isoform X5 n=1 Tax=Mytilus californianus TaxID=6549 RepID=UPI00224693B9|nr:neurocan core protein-like isoform X5 [Mytilus californianus]XP_052086114.1 neurocan core protein-like isoform X6 [Mytilus californianus]
MEFKVIVILPFLSCICNGNVFGPSTHSSVEADKKETGITCIQSDINVLKEDMHELVKRVFSNENDISLLKRENQYLTNELENKRRQFSCEINVLHENTNEHQRALNNTNTEINHLLSSFNETIEKLWNGVDKLEELERQRSEENITECIDKSVTPCSSSPCVNGGTCTPTGSIYVCLCPTGYNGNQCQVTPCSSSPCVNGGTCTPTGSIYVCVCPTGYNGNQCQVKPSCDNGWKMHDNNCYYFSSLDKNWNDAKKACKMQNSMLTDATSMSEINFLRTNAKKFQKTFWLDGSDRAIEGVWVWTSSGQKFSVTNWFTRTSQEPNNMNGNENCLQIYNKHDFEWNDDNCLTRHRYICKKTLM